MSGDNRHHLPLRGWGEHWIRESEVREARKTLAQTHQGAWWSIIHPIKAWRLSCKLRMLSEAKRKAQNELYVKKRLTDPILATLNEDQRRAVLVQEDRTCVVAGAGTGKTHTMVAKAHDTVRSGLAQANEIAFVTFTRKAAQEISGRSYDLPRMEIGTLHHLARIIITRAEGKAPRLSPFAKNESKRLEQFEQWLLEAVQACPTLLADMETRRQAVHQYVAPRGEKSSQIPVLPDRKLVRSVGEAQIATTFFLAGIHYQYEAYFSVPKIYRSRKHGRYKPDFYLPDNVRKSCADELQPGIHDGIWFEHFSHDMYGDLPARWDVEETKNYRISRAWKERLHKKLGTRFTWTEYGDIQRSQSEGQSFPDLVLAKIAALGKTDFKSPSQWDVRSIVEQMRADQAENRKYMLVTLEIDAWIRTRRQQVQSEQALAASFSKRGECWEEEMALYRLAQPILKRYERHLEDTDTIDHEKTILKALRYLQDGTVKSPWKVILVDEYQDVNPAQAAFIHALLAPQDSKHPSTRGRLTVVGDDWQAIMGFQGGDVELIRKFDDPINTQVTKAERITLTQTYRFGQTIADSTRWFVTKGKRIGDREVIGNPNIKPHPCWPSSIVMTSSTLTQEGLKRFGKRHVGFTGAVCVILEQVAAQAQNAQVLVVARRNIELNQPSMEVSTTIGINRECVEMYAQRYGIEMQWSTVHKAKGTEADYVILLDAGPPQAGLVASNRALEQALSVLSSSRKDEERRIWYVALTRAKRKVYVIALSESQSHSPFADELYQNAGGHYDVGKDELAEFLEPFRPSVLCPKCKKRGRSEMLLVMKDGRYGQFAGCTSFSMGPEYHCGYIENVCDSCEAGLMERVSGGYARCQNPRCERKVPLCRCIVPMPMAERRNKKTGMPFWGCQRFGYEGACRHTQPLAQSRDRTNQYRPTQKMRNIRRLAKIARYSKWV